MTEPPKTWRQREVLTSASQASAPGMADGRNCPAAVRTLDPGHGVLAVGFGVLAVSGTGKDPALLAAVQRFMLSYSGVFALVALTAAVAAGLVAADRIVMFPAGRVMAQAVHRALSLAAVGFLATHVVMEVLAHRSRPIDAVAPFLAGGRTLYLGVGTLASDLVLLVLVTGVARRRFAGRPAIWRAMHTTAYLAWPLAILHGLLAGRQAKPYVAWSYGACLAAVALALVIRLVAATRSRREMVDHPVPDPARLWTGHGASATALVPRQPGVSRPVEPSHRRPPLPYRPTADPYPHATGPYAHAAPTHRRAALPGGSHHGAGSRLCQSLRPRPSASGSRASPLASTGCGG
jgi:DMSO/TMAO reductase YedYZ heme-binding membrane subunit